MGEGITEAEIDRLSSRIQSYPRDFLQRFAGGGCADEHPEATGGDSDEIELSLGLSLGGCYGVDPKGKKLLRSSSIASLSSVRREPEFAAAAATALTRTSSLPTASEEERKKRKELQSLKRLEAKRKRSEKRNSMRPGAAEMDGGGQGSAAAAVMVGKFETGLNGCRAHYVGAPNGFSTAALPGWAAAAASVRADGGFPPMSQGSIGSQGSSSSGASEFDSRPTQGLDISGFSSGTEGMNKASATSPTRAMGKVVSCVGLEEDPAAKKLSQLTRRGSSGTGEMGRSMIEEMPCVSTRGDGPNGRRVEGFLYQYKKGEEVRIMCVCHGSFLTPAEFVKHAGGGDVAHPLRHIVVNPSPSAFL